MRLDVVSTGDYIEKNSEIVVSDVSGNRIVVKELRIEK
jgi:membrane-bound ClpP family serine protease